MRKTKVQIIEETAKAYTSETRSLLIEDGEIVKDDYGQPYCSYNGGDGKQCAFGRCCEEIPEKYERKTAYFILQQERDEILKPEYRGHPVSFWSSIQNLHDSGSNWNETGLSEQGEKRVEELIAEYSE